MRTVNLIVNDSYSTIGATGTTTFNVPMYYQSYSIELKYPDTPYGNVNFTETEYADLAIAYNIDLIKQYNFGWGGLSQTEKEVFDDFIKSFSNSFQPFQFQVDDGGIIFNKTFIVVSDTISISKDKFDLWSIEISFIEYTN